MRPSNYLLVFLALVLCSQCYAQEIVVEAFSEPVVANSQGKIVPISQADNVGGRADPSAPPQLLSASGSIRHQFEVLYRYTPGLVTPLTELRKRSSFDFQFEPKVKAALDKLLDNAISDRKKICDEYELKSLDQFEGIVKNNGLMQRVFDQELMADAKLSDLISEIVLPKDLSRYVTAMGDEFEVQVLSSKLFHELTNQKEIRFKERQSATQEFCKWAVAQQFSPDKDREPGLKVGKKLITQIYEDLTIEEFLRLKTLFGMAKAGEDVRAYQLRTKNSDSSIYVTAIKNLK